MMTTRTARTRNPPTMMTPLQPAVDLEDKRNHRTAMTAPLLAVDLADKRSHPMEMMTRLLAAALAQATPDALLETPVQITTVHQTPDVVQTAMVKTPATATELRSRQALETMTPPQPVAVMVDSSKAAGVVVAETMMTMSPLDQEDMEHQEDEVETLAATDKMTAPLVVDTVTSNSVVAEVTTTRRSEHEL
jgi:hypothetical protein